MKKIILLIMLALGLQSLPAQAFIFEHDKHHEQNHKNNANTITRKHFIIAAGIVVAIIGTFIIAAQKGYFKQDKMVDKENYNVETYGSSTRAKLNDPRYKTMNDD